MGVGPEVSGTPGGRAITKIATKIPAGEFLVYYFLTRDHIRFGFLIGARLLVGSAFRFGKGFYALRRRSSNSS
jgi:hypothetical protein